MDRDTLIDLLVLIAMADDYECVGLRFIPSPLKDRARRRLAWREEIKTSLSNLVHRGWALALAYSGDLQKYLELEQMPTSEEMDDLFYAYFYPTKEGFLALEQASGTWDDEGDVVENWREL